MSDQQDMQVLRKALWEILKPLITLITNLINPEKGEEWLRELKKFLRKETCWVKPSIINWLGTTTTSATTKKFIAREKFRKDSKEVKFYGFVSNFENWFLANSGKIEEPLDDQKLRYGNLTKNSFNGPIIEELGGEVNAETTLSELHYILKKQANGEEGVLLTLLTNGYANIFYIRDTSGLLRAVVVSWFDYGWSVGAYSLGSSDDWRAGRRVFSRNS